VSSHHLPVLQLNVNGQQVEVADDGSTLLDVLRDGLGVRTPKDGCSPQGQCGCCTVFIDGAARVACVTPARRVAGRSVVTLEGLPEPTTQRWAEAFSATGASQCGFCTPGIIMRLEALRSKGIAADDVGAVERALQAHLCRCTGWQTIVEAYQAFGDFTDSDTGLVVGRERSLEAASRRATIEGGTTQVVGADIVLGRAGFAADTVPDGALIAVPDGTGGWSVGETLAEARRRAGKVQGRRTTAESVLPISLPVGDWVATLRTSWVEPAYLETDAAWCEPDGEPASPLANGGAFGGKVHSPAPEAARALSIAYGQPVLVLLSREDSVRLGPKRPPMAAGIRADGTGVVVIARTEGVADHIRSIAPLLEVIEVDVPGPPTSMASRAVGWAEVVLLNEAANPTAIGSPIRVQGSTGAFAEADITPDGVVHVRVSCGDPLDEIVLRSYVIGAAHMAIGWVTSESLTVDEVGEIHDLTIRSFGVLRAVDMPHVAVNIEMSASEPKNGSDAAFVAVAAAVWRHQGFPPQLPTAIRLRS